MGERFKRFQKDLKRPSNAIGLAGVAACALGLADGMLEQYLGVDVLPGETTWSSRSDYIPSSINMLKLFEIDAAVIQNGIHNMLGLEPVDVPRIEYEKLLHASEWSLREWTATIASASLLAGAATPGVAGKASTAFFLSASVFGAAFAAEQLAFLSAGMNGLSIPDTLVWGGTATASTAAATQRAKKLLR